MKKLTEDQLAKGLADGEVVFEWGTILDNPEPKKDTSPAAKPPGANPNPETGQPHNG